MELIAERAAVLYPLVGCDVVTAGGFVSVLGVVPGLRADSLILMPSFEEGVWS